MRILTVAGLIAVFTSTASSFQFDGQWKRITPPEGPFAVIMPGTPAHVRKTDDTPHGKIVQHTYGLGTRRGLLEVIYAEYPFVPNPEKELPSNRDQFIADTGTKLVSESQINYWGNPGIEFRCENGESTFIVRIYVVNRTVYELAGGGHKSRVDFEEIGRFLNSFQLVEK